MTYHVFKLDSQRSIFALRFGCFAVLLHVTYKAYYATITALLRVFAVLAIAVFVIASCALLHLAGI